MSQVKGENQGMLRGEVLAVPKLSHHNHGVDYYLVPFRVPRLSGAEDVVNLVVSQPQEELWQPGNWLEVGGEVRSYNNRSGQGSRLVITMLVREALQGYVDRQRSSFEFYLPDQYQVAQDARLETLEGGTVLLVMCQDADQVLEAIRSDLESAG